MDEGPSAAVRSHRAELALDAVEQFAVGVTKGLQTLAAEVRGDSGEVYSGGRGIIEEIAEFAGSTQASLVVIGSRGMTGLKALGSVSERVAHRAPCSVLIVRRAAHPRGEIESGEAEPS